MVFLPLVIISSFAQPQSIEAQLREIEAQSKGKLGAAIITPTSSYYSGKGQRFSLQSVMKMVVSMAALDYVDQGKWKRGQKFTFRRSDLSLSVQPLIDKLGSKSQVTVTLEECIELTVTQSCSAAGDFLIRKMGGTARVNAFLKSRGISGLSVDRQERDLQTNIKGLTWRPEFVDVAKLNKAIVQVSGAKRDEAYKRYQDDPRDTTTPEAMGLLLQKLVTGKLLSSRSSKYLISVMEKTETGPDRLKAGVPTGWILGHKTGTSGSNKGVTCALNDVGFARRASGEWVVIVAMLKNSTANDDEMAATLSKVAKVALANR
jgi:beta-lactamase class A